jgi:ribosomal protein L37AE/L43A
MLKFIYELVRAQRMRRSMDEPARDDACVACGNRSVQVVAPAVYRCGQCGYEGGSGLAARRTQQRREQIAGMSPEQRRMSAAQDLLEARTLLTSCLGDIASASSLAVMDLVNISSDPAGEGVEKSQQLTAAIGLVLEARAKVADAELKLASNIGATQGELSAGGYLEGVMDIQGDNIVADLMSMSRISAVGETARKLLADVERALARLPSLPVYRG